MTEKKILTKTTCKCGHSWWRGSGRICPRCKRPVIK